MSSVDESEVSNVLSDGLAMVNMDIQVNPSQSVYQILTRASEAFSDVIVCVKEAGEVRGEEKKENT